MADGTALLDVKIDFEQSHLFFPQIIHWILLILAGMILIRYVPACYNRYKQANRALETKGKADDPTSTKTPKGSIDWLRLGGTLVLTVVYFTLMDSVGTFFPNMGLGFLLMSIPFMFLLSLLYVHNASRRQLITITLSSLISPTVAWYLLAQVFNISLP